MAIKQIRALHLTTQSTKSQVKLKKLEMVANFWTNLDKRLPNFPQRQFDNDTYSNTDSILSRSITAKEIFNTIHKPNSHLAHSLTFRIWDQPLTLKHPCLYTGQPTGPTKAKIADLYYNWNRYYSTSLKDATEGNNLEEIVRMMMNTNKSCYKTAKPLRNNS